MRKLEIPEDNWNYMCDLMKKTMDALDRDAPNEYIEDYNTLKECLDMLLTATKSKEDKER